MDSSGQAAIVPLETSDPGTADERIETLEAQVRELRSLLSKSAPKPPAISVPKAPKYPNIELNGMLHIDGGVIAQDDANVDLVGDINNSLGFRRARLGVAGFLTEHLYYRLVPDFAVSGRPSFRDAYVEYVDFPESRQPFGMESQTPASQLMFLERSVAFALSPFRQVGLGMRNRNEDETLTWHASVFGYPSGQFGTAVSDSGFGVAARSTAILWEDNATESLIHIGADYSYLHPNDNPLRFRSVPEYNGLLTGADGTTAVVPPFVDTGLMMNASSNAFGLELATIQGPLVVQGEIVTTAVDLDGGDSATFNGAYIHGAYVLTDDRHKYNREFGNIERLLPRHPVGEGGWGAWELTARLSALDLNDGPIDGGRIHDLTLGMNWYFNKNAYLQFNYIHAWVDRAPVGDNSANIYASRFAVDF